MTCISVIKQRSGKLIMSGDRRVTDSSDMVRPAPNPKIKKINGFVVGGCGDFSILELCLNNLKLMDIQKDELTDYMYHHFLKELNELFKRYGYRDEHNLLKLPGDGFELLIGRFGRLFSVELHAPEDKDDVVTPSRLGICECTLPHAVGSGSPYSIAILVAMQSERGHSLKSDLVTAQETAAKLNSGCDRQIDYIGE